MPGSAIRLQRANFLVTNLERSLGFYCDILGMTLNFQKVSEIDSYSYDVFEIDHEAQMRFAVLDIADQPRAMALTEVRGIELPPVPKPRRAAIVLDIADIDGVVARSKAAGLQVYEEDHLITNDGREGREVGIVDYDDNLVVIYHITKAAP